MADPERIAIIGLGLIGGSLALALRRAKPALRIIGVDVDVRAREMALEEGAVDTATWLNDAALEVCDAVVLSTPAQPLLEMIPLVADRMREGAVLTDVCGAKERICAQGAAQDKIVFVGGHPMAGTEYRGFVAANPSLFAGATVAICPPVGRRDESARREGLMRVRELWIAAGADKLLEVEPVDHDKAVTWASHLPYLAAASVVEMMLAAGESAPLARELAAGGFRDTTRLAGDGTVGGAAALNRSIPGAARALADRLRQLADELERSPDKALERLGAVADERRRMRLPSASAGTTSPLSRR
ncbi:MAG TPA: prephenate dehydrogenase [Myxococcales bacterium]|nr:prephenate dehydrogenase [Myxococcales bacterium]